MSQIDDIMALLTQPEGPRVPLAPGSLATFAEELPAEPQHYRGPEPNRGAIERMARHDALPPAWRAQQVADILAALKLVEVAK